MVTTYAQGGLRRRRVPKGQESIYIELVDLSDSASHKPTSQWKSSAKRTASRLLPPKSTTIFPPINMFASIVGFTMLALPILAVATPTPVARGDAGSCNTGPIQCCNSTEMANSAAGSALLGLLGVALQDVNVMLGLGCSPISVVGVGSGSECNASPVCCENNNVGGLISIGCVPVSL